MSDEQPVPKENQFVLTIEATAEVIKAEDHRNNDYQAPSPEETEE